MHPSFVEGDYVFRDGLAEFARDSVANLPILIVEPPLECVIRWECLYRSIFLNGQWTSFLRMAEVSRWHRG